MKTKIFTAICIFLLAMSSPGAYAQKNAKKQQPVKSEYKVRVVDEAGSPIAGVLIYVNEGKDVIRTDADGLASVKADPADIALLEAEGFGKVTMDARKLGGGDIVLRKEEYLAGEKDIVDATLYTRHQINEIGAVTTIDVSGIRDIVNSDDWKKYLEVTGSGIFGEANVRYAGYTYVIDGMMKDDDGMSYADYISSEEIESITILKDASSKILYGARPEGVICIKTKRGEAHKRLLNVHYEYSLGQPVMYPEYLGAADYMQLYNEARANDGLSPRYSETDIQATRIGYDPIQYPDVEFYSSEFLRNFKQMHKARVETSGGNNRATYYFMLGYDYNTSILKLGESAKANDNTVRMRGNVDLRITDWLKARVDMAMVLNNGYSGRGSFWSMAASRRPNENSLLIPISRIGEEYADLVEEARNQKSIINGEYLLAGNNVYTSNLYGDSVLSGYNRNTNLATNVNIGFDVDLKFITPGLKFNTYFGLDNNNTYTISQSNSYAVYDVTFKLNPYEDLDDMMLVKFGQNNFIGSQGISGVSMNRKIGWYNVLNYNRTFGGKHALDVVATSRLSDYTTQGQIYSLRKLDYGLSANYMYDRRYVIEASTVAVASPYLQKSQRVGVAGSIGFGWVISEEGFMENSGIDLLKLKASSSLLKIQPTDYNFSRDTYSKGSAYTYNDGSSKNNLVAVSVGNPDLTFADDYEMNFGIETALLDKSLFAEFNYFTVNKQGVVSTTGNQYMSTLGGSAFIMRQNFASKGGAGWDLNIRYDKALTKDFSIGLDFGLVHYDAFNWKVDELDYGPGMDYYKKSGKSVSAIWGLVADGLYTQEEIDLVNDPDDTTLPKPSFGTVKAGDVKYIDQNGDNVIDALDEKVIGDTRSKYNCRLGIQLRYRNLALFAQLRSQIGGSSLYTGDYYQVYGEMKYPSYLMKERWAYDPANGIDTRNTATYPRLSTAGGTNNFKDSTLWMASTDFFKIPLVQLTWFIPEKIASRMGMSSPNIYFRGTTLCTIGPDSDKLQRSIGSSPQFRWYTFGFKANF